MFYERIVGQEIRILTMKAPPLLYSKQALAAVGPESETYQVKKVLSILDSQVKLSQVAQRLLNKSPTQVEPSEQEEIIAVHIST